MAYTLRFVKPRTVELEERDLPTPDATEVLVACHQSLVSGGTELLIYRGEAPRNLEADKVIDSLDGDLSFPLTYGYAAVGEVQDSGAAVPGEWNGELVFVFHPHASHFTVAFDDLIRVPDDVSGDVATFLPIAETAVNLVLDGAPLVGERVVVFGAGLVGLLTVSTLAEFPLTNLTVVEPVMSRRERAISFGADTVVSPDELSSSEHDADLVFEVSGRPEALDEAISVVGYDGRIVVGSWYGEKRVDLNLGDRFHRERISFVSSQVSTITPDLRGRWDTDRRMDLAWDQLRSSDVSDLITHRIPITEAERAYPLLEEHPERALGVLFTY